MMDMLYQVKQNTEDIDSLKKRFSTAQGELEIARQEINALRQELVEVKQSISNNNSAQI